MRKALLSVFILFIAVLFYSCSETTGPACNNNLPAVIAQLYSCGPDVDNCYEGKLKPDEGIKVWAKLKEIRDIHRLQEVSINPDDEKYVQAAALIICANEVMNHQPGSDSKCYTKDGYIGSNEGNLWLGSASQVFTWLSENMVLDWLIDDGVETLGHRRWLLNPFMRNTAFGRVDKILSSGKHVTAAAIKVYDTAVYWAPFTSDIDFVAYPYGEKYPANAFKTDWYLSFTAIIDKMEFWNNKAVNYSEATILMTDENGSPVPVKSVEYNTDNYGVPNVIQWKADGLAAGKKYNVTIRKVKYKLKDIDYEKDYSYTFKLVTTS